MSKSIPGKKTVLLVGASGELGGLIARALLAKPDVALRCLVRPGSRSKLSAFGADTELVEGDLQAGSEAALLTATAGVSTVVSAVQGGPDVIVDGQLRLFRAALAAGVRRFIPSSFSIDLFNLAEGENINSDWRRRFAATAEQEDKNHGIELVHVLNGCFMDKSVLFGFLGAIDLGSHTIQLWGDGKALMNFTTYQDTARFTAEAATDPRPLPKKFNVAGDTLTFHDLVSAYEQASGKKLTVQKLGSLIDLGAEIDRRRKADPANLFAYLPLMYWRGMLSGKGRLGELANGRYPNILPTTVREYVRQEGL